MAQLIDIWLGDDQPVQLENKQMPFAVNENLSMIMDISNLEVICVSPLIRGKILDDFIRKLDTLTNEEARSSFQVTNKDILDILGKFIPCVGCRRSAETMLRDLSYAGYPLLHPLFFPKQGLLTVKEEVLESPQLLCTILHNHSARLSALVDTQTRSKKSLRCALHSLEIQRIRPPRNAWIEVWECLNEPCKSQIAIIKTGALEDTLEMYLKKHRFCTECRSKILLASSLLTSDCDATQETGYVASLYAGIKHCVDQNHVHLPINTEYITALIARAQPDAAARDRHAKTLEIAQEEVVTCLGICLLERLNKLYRQIKEAEMICKVLGAVAVEALSRNFEMAVEAKQGVSKLELLYEEFKRKEIAKQQKQEKQRLKKKKKKKELHDEAEKENKCNCLSEASSSNDKDSCNCSELKPVEQNIDRDKLQVLDPINIEDSDLKNKEDFDPKNKENPDPVNKEDPDCKCSDCEKKDTSIEKTEPQIPKKSVPQVKKSGKKNTSKKKDKSKSKGETPKKTSKKTSEQVKKQKVLDSKEIDSSKLEDSEEKDTKLSSQESESQEWSLSDDPVEDLTNVWLDRPNNMWTEMKDHMIAKMTDKTGRSSSEHSSRDRGYSSEHYVSSGSFPCTPDGSEVACSDGFCNHEETTYNRIQDRTINIPSLRTKRCERPSLLQLLEDPKYAQTEYYIPQEEIDRFQSRRSQILERRQELRDTLRDNFERMLCNHCLKPLIPH